MRQDIIHTILLAGSFLVLFGIAELLYHLFKLKAEHTRKLVHVGTGLLTLFFPLLLNDQWFVFILCASFALLLIASLRYKLLPSINAIERKSVGSIAYPVSVYGCYLAYDHFDHRLIYFYLPILILAISDPLAALTGKKWPKGSYQLIGDSKTLMGSSMFLLSALIICMLLFNLLDPHSNLFSLLLRSVIISLLATIAEAISKKGLDNCTIPAAVLIGLVITHQLL